MITAREHGTSTGLSLLAGLCLAILVWVDPAAAQDGVKVKPLDFPLPSTIEAVLPADADVADVFVSDDLCFYLRSDGAFFFLGCVG